MEDGGYDTDPERERSKGRIPVWLDVEHVRHLLQLDFCESRAEGEAHDLRCKYLHFRLQTALHKEGLRDEPPS